MEINPEAWPGLILNFGPYAILILFVLWVAPHASKRMQTLADNAPMPVRIATITTVIACWTVVLVMVIYVLFQWSPVRVYVGDLGVLEQPERIYPLDDNIYVKVEGTQAPNRDKWHFVFLDHENSLKSSDLANFTYYWGSQDNQYTDYSIPVSIISSGEVLDFRFTKKEAEAAYTWTEGEWNLASSIGLPETFVFNWRWNAYANDSLKEIADQLASPNRLQRAQARTKMRKLNDNQLQKLLAMSSNQVAKNQIQLELDRRR